MCAACWDAFSPVSRAGARLVKGANEAVCVFVCVRASCTVLREHRLRTYTTTVGLEHTTVLAHTFFSRVCVRVCVCVCARTHAFVCPSHIPISHACHFTPGRTPRLLQYDWAALANDVHAHTSWKLTPTPESPLWSLHVLPSHKITNSCLFFKPCPLPFSKEGCLLFRPTICRCPPTVLSGLQGSVYNTTIHLSHT